MPARLCVYTDRKCHVSLTIEIPSAAEAISSSQLLHDVSQATTGVESDWSKLKVDPPTYILAYDMIHTVLLYIAVVYDFGILLSTGTCGQER